MIFPAYTNSIELEDEKFEDDIVWNYLKWHIKVFLAIVVCKISKNSSLLVILCDILALDLYFIELILSKQSKIR